ncbi:MAG: thioredoxin-disulfide reductase [Prevotella sp.]|nr:thioredoxin-disulfide reductase [Prevotella sp.]MDY4040091.1 thioredoxin-disulfide reductase [Prevotella sp.]
MEHVRCLIIGSGPAGYTAAIYAGRANLSPVLYTGMQLGGQLTQTTVIENFPGYPDGIDANEMMENFRQHAARFGAELREGTIVKADFSKKPYVFTTDRDVQVSADAVILATGAAAKYLGLPDEEKYKGTGVSGCATCDGFFYRKKVTAVVGGGDTACEDALYLSHICKQVYLIVRKPYLRASEIMQQRVREAENIQILFEHNATGLYGENGVEGVHLVKRKGEADEEHYDLPIDGFFLAIGHTPNTGFVKGQIDLDEMGFIRTEGNSQRTNVPGVFAAGDVCDPIYRQAVVAAGSGCKAALEAERYLSGLCG